jgi:putative copper export protein
VFDVLLFLHILAAALWLGSGAAILVIARRALAEDDATFGTVAVHAGWWAGRAHPAAGVVLLLTGPAMVADADIGFGTTWVVLGLVGLLVLFAVGGALTGRTSTALSARLRETGGALTADMRPQAEAVLRYSGIEVVLLVLVIADMVFKPGG